MLICRNCVFCNLIGLQDFYIGYKVQACNHTVLTDLSIRCIKVQVCEGERKGGKNIGMMKKKGRREGENGEQGREKGRGRRNKIDAN